MGVEYELLAFIAALSPEIPPAFGYYCIAQIKDDPSFATV